MSAIEITAIKLEALLAVCENVGITPEQLNGYHAAKCVAAQVASANAEEGESETLEGQLKFFNEERDIIRAYGHGAIEAMQVMAKYVGVV